MKCITVKYTGKKFQERQKKNEGRIREYSFFLLSKCISFPFVVRSHFIFCCSSKSFVQKKGSNYVNNNLMKNILETLGMIIFFVTVKNIFGGSGEVSLRHS